MDITENRCTCCHEVCNIVEEVYHYTGTHCTNGKDGFYRTGHYTSECCDDEYEETTIYDCTLKESYYD